MTRTCPVCRVLMHRVDITAQVEIDVCLSCKGLWFDKGELTYAYQRGESPEKLSETSNLSRDQVVCQACGVYNLRSRRKCASCGAALNFLCPVCQAQMEEVTLGNVSIDRCRNCQGIWLDGGELGLLFEEFKQAKQAEMEQVRHAGAGMTDDLATWATIENLDTLLWTPKLLYDAGKGTVETDQLSLNGGKGNAKTKAGTAFIDALFRLISFKH